MDLDLARFTTDWQPARETIAARIVNAADGTFVQLRVDLGILQMVVSGRPDGARYRNQPTALEYLRQKLRSGGEAVDTDWRDLERELHQFHYRRLAWAGLADDAIAENDIPAAVDHLRRTISDLEHCFAGVTLMTQHREGAVAAHPGTVPALVFNRARLRSRLLALEDRFEEAVEEAEAGVADLDAALEEAGADEVQREEDPGLAFLRQTAARLRAQHGIGQTLAERLADAVAKEDFVTAAKLRDELRRRRQNPRS
jgi:protein-arginine kinase activator protein McsA